VRNEKQGENMAKYKVVQPEDRKWDPHPQLPGVEVVYLISRRADDVDITSALVHLPVGSKVEKHVHENSDDIILVLKGKAKMWIEGVGDVPLAPGTFLRIPKGTQHQPHDIEEDFVAHDTWYPALA
jgi:mannose-6-phosphate isomerase-like protein (cupin superfamily)